jgi:hypothetical protein
LNLFLKERKQLFYYLDVNKEIKDGETALMMGYNKLNKN